MTEAVRLSVKFAQFAQYWTPKIVGELNDNYLLLAKLKGEFVWHQHDAEDELFLVVHGRLLIRLRDREVWLEAGDLFVVPAGVEHCPVAEEEVHVLLVEPKQTHHTGSQVTEHTVSTYERL